ncbi:MAG TPA: helix-turn-helix domain-containing protein [Baekduia sp.]|uniref:TetR/AcrR family transcriptional regulator n=1 Tax=Baekduia sp. TaxID=2600305 RepID=UPI002C2717E2|nr:helix-turn-helix domain-containing protein [Baekduia sp.]HMJ33754.1 helix-turn-helix domain-containing protein [Baekduia sp.]
MALATDPRPRRADALRNRERVIRAAAAVFAEKGMEAGIPEIAERAGVGKATVYRSFPSKEHLVAAVAAERLDWITTLATQALAEEDAGAAFEHVILAIAERQAGDCAVAGSLAADIHLPELDAARATAHASLDALVDRARLAGALRDDAGAEDLRVLFTGVAHVLRSSREHDPSVWGRYGELIVNALRAR